MSYECNLFFLFMRETGWSGLVGQASTAALSPSLLGQLVGQLAGTEYLVAKVDR